MNQVLNVSLPDELMSTIIFVPVYNSLPQFSRGFVAGNLLQKEEKSNKNPYVKIITEAWTFTIVFYGKIIYEEYFI